MTSTSRYFIKTSFIFFILGIICGLWQYGHYVFQWSAPNTLIMAHTHIILVGGVMNMIIGVSTWFFPRSKKGYRFYDPQLMWILYWLLLFATLGRFYFEILAGYQINRDMLIPGFWAALLQIVTLFIIFFQLWDRIRSKGSNIREARGQAF